MKFTNRQADRIPATEDRSFLTLRQIQKRDAAKPAEPKPRVFNTRNVTVSNGGLTEREHAEALQQLAKFRPAHLIKPQP